jgi:hypothetical protein
MVQGTTTKLDGEGALEIGGLELRDRLAARELEVCRRYHGRLDHGKTIRDRDISCALWSIEAR